MCGRFFVTREGLIRALEALGIDIDPLELDEIASYGEIFPEQPVAITGRNPSSGGIFTGTMGWGFTITHYNRETQQFTSYNEINARVETVYIRKSFADSAKFRPCIISSDFYYEWYYRNAILKNGKMHKQGKGVKMEIANEDGSPMYLAGIWREERREVAGMRVAQKRFVILTTSPNAEVAHIHDRMPVILTSAQAHQWLEGHTDINSLIALNQATLVPVAAAGEQDPAEGPQQLSLFDNLN